VTKVTGSIGKGLSAATFDSEYQNRRRMAQRRNKPRHAVYGVTAGAEALATSVASGFEGVVMKPIEGAESGGAVGFFKGVGKGIVGAVTKPVIGVLDLASNVTEGIRNTTTVFDAPKRDRVRVPRLVPSDGVLVPYSRREALGQAMLRDLGGGRYRDDVYVAHLNLPSGDCALMLTNNRAVCFWTISLDLDWDIPFTRLAGVSIEDDGIRFVQKSTDQQEIFVPIPDRSSKAWFFKEVEKVVSGWNAQRRMDK